MKNPVLIVLLLFFANSAFAQVRRDSVKIARPANRAVMTNAKVIPSSRAVVIRKNVGNLKVELTRLSDSVTVTKREIDLLIHSMEKNMDSMSEMSETESLRLQMAMDRLSKMMATLSNVMKKISDTQQQITQNLK